MVGTEVLIYGAIVTAQKFLDFAAKAEDMTPAQANDEWARINGDTATAHAMIEQAKAIRDARRAGKSPG